MYVVHLGYSGFPSGQATAERIRLTFKALKIGGFNPLIINKCSLLKIENKTRVNHYQGIPYIFSSFSATRSDSFILRNLNKLSGYFGELFVLVKKRKKICAALFYGSSFREVVFYRILSKILKFKLIIQYVELRSSIPERKSLVFKINDWMFDNYCFYFCDGIIVISDFLLKRTRLFKDSLPTIKVPAICDYEEFNFHPEPQPRNYLMYCGSIIYLSVIEFVLDIFCNLRRLHIYDGELLFVVGRGNKDMPFVKKLEEKILNCGYNSSITLKSNISRNELIQSYLNAELLIVPLRNTTQDIARFSHKIGEYTATGKPIISTDIGEMRSYFTDGISAILASEYSVDSYIKKISEIIDDKEKLASIGIAGQTVGQKYLNYRNYSAPLVDFIKNI